jgi:hypothetical protein
MRKCYYCNNELGDNERVKTRGDAIEIIALLHAKLAAAQQEVREVQHGFELGANTICSLTAELEAARHDYQALIKVRDMDITRLTAELEAMKEAHRWIPVTEKVPETGVYVAFWNGIEPQFGYHTRGIPRWTASGGPYYLGNNYHLITHWQPLPQPPTETTEPPFYVHGTGRRITP